ncbi:hypothetical protein L799_24805 [Enterobacter roggenkampii EC_38VIM1]|uniref:hypothetical protein n=1 Tax=Enterobacter roggenkampii TaxID=1812935 RepID=UPI0003859BE3|nr:hypothetical protein [Enterobacter roggenkampii]EPY93787.1 hypothetical protein L799_24805 [Enterobacter roggenkampii EC_38VIM1]
MMLFDNGYQELARNVVGRKLRNVNGLIYIYNVPELGAPQQLQFVFFDENQNVAFRCGLDGASLELTDLPMQENDLGEYGKEEIMDLSNSCFFHKVIGKILLRFYAIYSEIEQKVIGAKLFFDEGLTLAIINLGDEIKVFDSLSMEYERDEKIIYIDVLSIF